MTPWKNFRVRPDEGLNLEQGFLSLQLYSGQGEWHTAITYEKEEPAHLTSSILSEKPADREWRRWILPSQSEKVNVLPAMPNRPLVVRPAFVMKIPGGIKAEFNVGIPIWLQVYADKDRRVFEVPTEVLSNTWFGPMEAGELCYALKSSIHPASEPLKPFIHKAICPIHITNESKDDLELQRICIQAQHLSIYQGKDHLWTNRVRISYQGEDQTSDVTVDNKAPGPKSDFDLLSEPREKVSGSFVKRTFSSFMEMAGI